jgi:hypothetical protein
VVWWVSFVCVWKEILCVHWLGGTPDSHGAVIPDFIGEKTEIQTG